VLNLAEEVRLSQYDELMFEFQYRDIHSLHLLSDTLQIRLLPLKGTYRKKYTKITIVEHILTFGSIHT
jgi:hypothetical protein